MKKIIDNFKDIPFLNDYEYIKIIISRLNTNYKKLKMENGKLIGNEGQPNDTSLTKHEFERSMQQFDDISLTMLDDMSSIVEFWKNYTMATTYVNITSTVNNETSEESEERDSLSNVTTDTEMIEESDLLSNVTTRTYNMETTINTEMNDDIDSTPNTHPSIDVLNNMSTANNEINEEIESTPNKVNNTSK